MTIDWAAQAVDQLDWHWRAALRPRLDGLADDEYLWSPTPDAWTIHPDGPGARIDWAYPAPDPAPVTTIAWRLAHLVVGVFGLRNASHFGGPALDYDTFPYARTGAEALGQLDEGYARWLAGVRGWAGDGTLGEPVGSAEGPGPTSRAGRSSCTSTARRSTTVPRSPCCATSGSTATTPADGNGKDHRCGDAGDPSRSDA